MKILGINQAATSVLKRNLKAAAFALPLLFAAESCCPNYYPFLFPPPPPHHHPVVPPPKPHHHPHHHPHHYNLYGDVIEADSCAVNFLADV